MEHKDLLLNVKGVQKQLTLLLKNLKSIDKYSSNPLKNLDKILKIFEATRDFDVSKESTLLSEEFKKWREEYKGQIESLIEEEKTLFGVRLEEELNKNNVSFTPKSHCLYAGLFIIKWDVLKGTCLLGYGPNADVLSKLKLDPAIIVKEVVDKSNELGCKLSPFEYVTLLKKAYTRLSSNPEESVPLAHLHVDMAVLLQGKNFYKNPSKETFKNYSKMDFSYDLYRTRQVGVESGVSLKTATLAQTKKQSDFLWIPTRNSVENGEYFAEIKVTG